MMTRAINESVLSGNNEDYNRPFTQKELSSAVSQLKVTSPGLDKIDNMFFRNLNDEGLEYLLMLFNKCWFDEYVPVNWKEALLIPILKHGKPKEKVSSYRPIMAQYPYFHVLENC